MKTFAKFVLGILIAFLLLTCGTRRLRYDAPRDETRTLRVLNETGSHVHIYIGRIKIGVATSGENCFQLRGISEGYQYLSIRPTAGMTLRTMMPEDFRRTSWSMTLQRVRPQDLRFDLLSLQPAERCRG